MIKAYWLLVDNDEDDREIFQIALREVAPCITLYTAAAGNEAIHLLKSERILPSIIFLDINMPWIDGFELLK